MKGYICPVCGYDQLDSPPRDEDGYGSQNICVCCGTQFGYDDAVKNLEDSEERWHNLREKWLNEGAKWFMPSKKPKNWKLKDQLNNIGK